MVTECTSKRTMQEDTLHSLMPLSAKTTIDLQLIKEMSIMHDSDYHHWTLIKATATNRNIISITKCSMSTKTNLKCQTQFRSDAVCPAANEETNGFFRKTARSLSASLLKHLEFFYPLLAGGYRKVNYMLTRVAIN